MNKITQKKAEGIAYWERRRWVYNLILVVPTVLGWMLGSEDMPRGTSMDSFSPILAAGAIFFCAVGANICYSFAYVLEFVLLSDGESKWTKVGRSITFVAGCAFSALLAAKLSHDLAVSLGYGPFP